MNEYLYTYKDSQGRIIKKRLYEKNEAMAFKEARIRAKFRKSELIDVKFIRKAALYE